MRINAVRLKIMTDRGEFGFCVPFGRGLTIIRGNNSSGKSTIFLSLLYGLGMEEIAGGRNEIILPYAVKDHFNYLGERVNVLASEVYVEIENKRGEIVTFRRAIRDNQRNSKLIEVLDGAFLTGQSKSLSVRPTYLHDAGGAQKEEGFHKFLERFLGFNLPSVPTTSGGEAKLYLQAIFAAVAVEQKRGWTDYIANIPFFGIRDARTRVVEFLLSLDVFETNSARSQLNADSVNIAASWETHYLELQRLLKDISGTMSGVPSKVSVLFDPKQTQLQKLVGVESSPLPLYITKLRADYARLSEKANSYRTGPPNEQQAELDSTTQELQRLTNLYETASASLGLQKASVKEYEQLYSEAAEDLTRNKTTLKLRNLGAEREDIELANDRCPTCHQYVEDSLLTEYSHGPQMDLETNIQYLDKQARMLDRQIAGGQKAVVDTARLLDELSTRIDATRIKLNAVRSDVATDATESRAIIRQQIHIEVEIEMLEKAEKEIAKLIGKFLLIADRLKRNQSDRKNIPTDYYSDEDVRKIRIFEKLFRANASAFQYESAPIADIKINDDTLVPYLANIELREILANGSRKQTEASRPATDIKADSSASDFVRLILSYLLALHQASKMPNGGGRHPGIMILDEPGQHSMGQSTQRALLQQLSTDEDFQAIVAASFDESPEVFREVTQGIRFDLVELDQKSIQPVEP